MTDIDNIVWHSATVSRQARESRQGHRGVVIWLTGLSGCGKSTVGNELESILFEKGCATTLLDGDNVRHGLCGPSDRLRSQYGDELADRFGLGFGELDRQENIRRVGHVAAMMAASGLMTITAFVSPYRKDRDDVRRIVDESRQGDFFEVFVDTPLEICEQRDPKGLYKKARAGEIKNFTGISDPYEAPTNPEVHLIGGNDRTPLEQAKEIANRLVESGVIQNTDS